MSRPLISVVIAVYNGQRTIQRAIESVLAQTYAAHELIVVDDGSIDGTRTIVESFGGRVRYIAQPNAGVAAARNAGADVATGAWLAFLDADDWYYPHRLSWHADLIARFPNLDFCTGDYEYRRADGSLISRSMEITELGDKLLRTANGAREVFLDAADMAPFVENHFGDTHTLTVPRRSFMRLGGYPGGFAVCEDVHFLVRLCSISQRVGVICEPMAVYEIHASSATRLDPLRAQRLNLQTLAHLGPLLESAPLPIRQGYRGRLRHARQNLAYALLREHCRWEALRVAVTSVVDEPSFKTLRNLGSIARGALQAHLPDGSR